VEFYVWGPLGGPHAENPNKLFRSLTLSSKRFLACALPGRGPMKSLHATSIGHSAMLHHAD
jgi:hypothetical protein